MSVILISKFQTENSEPKYTTYLDANGILRWLKDNYKLNSKGEPTNQITTYAMELEKVFFNEVNKGKRHVVKFPFIRIPWLFAIAKFKFDLDLDEIDGTIRYTLP